MTDRSNTPDVSLAQTGEFACPQCGQAIHADVWLIVDVAARPDLAARIRAGDLHIISCPTCGPQGAVNAPLLLYLADHDPAIGQPPLIFSPALRTSAEEDQQQGMGLLRGLARRLGDSWQDEWLGEIATVQRELLPAALSADPAATMQEGLTQRRRDAEEEDDDMPPARIAALEDVLAQLGAEGVTVDSPEALAALLAARPDLAARLAAAVEEAEQADDDKPGIPEDTRFVSDNEASLPDLIKHFLAAETWDESQRIVEAHPELLGDEVDERFALALAEYADNAEAVAILTTHHALLRRCRAVGIARAFAEQMLGADGQAEAERLGLAPEEFLAQMPPALREALAELAAAGSEIRSQEDLERALAARPDLRARLEARMPDDDGPSVPPEFAEDLRCSQEGERRYLRTGDQAALDAAAAAWGRILAAPGFDGADARFRLTVLNDSGGIYLRRYWARGRVEDLNNALTLWQQAVTLTQPDSPDRPSLLNNLSAGLSDRYARTGQLADLEEAIRVSQQAVTLTPPDSPDRPGYLNNLGIGLSARYGRTGRLEDLEEAIRVYQQAVTLTPPDSPDRPGYLNNLGNGLRARYARTGRLEDLEEAILVYQQAVTLTQPDSPDRPSLLNNLGTGLSARYARTGRLEDLEEAIRVYQQAVTLTPPDSPDRPKYLNNLGTGLRARYARTGQLEDLEEAICVYQQAVTLTPPDSPDRPAYLNNLGNGLSARYACTGRLADLEEAIRRYRATCELGAALAPEEVLRAARNWGRWAMQRQAWAEVDEAYGHGLAAGRGLRGRQLRRADKENWMGSLQEMAPAAAYAQARRSDPIRAAVTLEAGRAQLLAEALEQNRRDLERLPGLGHAELYTRYLAVLDERQRLEQPDAIVVNRLAAIEAAEQEFAAVVADIRAVAGYADFFAEPTFARIQAAAQEVPLVYIAATAAGGLALVVHPGGVETVWLDGLTEAALQTTIFGPNDDPALGGYLGAYDRWRSDRTHDSAIRAAWHQVLDNTTAWQWDVVMAPVVAHLTQTGLGEAVLIPSGLLGLLPLHAAWTPGALMPTGRRYALDSVTIRYAPSATALAAGQERSQRLSADGILAVDNPDGSLTFSGQEVAAGINHFAPERRLHLAGTSATLDAVKQTAASLPVLHFSTHGWAGWSEPLEGGLLLADDARLTLAALLDMKLPNARLAVLSACETGVPGTKVPDEVIGLPAGLLQAGVAGVAASLWAVNDLSTARLMERFYQEWLETGLSPAAALCRAQHWLRDVTREELGDYYASFIRRMSPQDAQRAHAAITLGGEPGDRPYSHPYYWAAFTFTGA